MTIAQRLAGAAALMCLAAWSLDAAAQSRRRPAAPPFHTLTLEEGIAPMGRIGGFSGRADGAGHRIVAENLSVVQPVTVLAIAADRADPVRVDLVKGGWDEARRSGTTGEDRRLVFKTRTEGSLGIVVRSAGDQPASYVLAVWAGDEMPSEPPSMFRAAADGSRAGGGAHVGTLVLWFAAGAVVLVLAGMYVWRRAQTGRRASP